jgi:kinesin family protein 5
MKLKWALPDLTYLSFLTFLNLNSGKTHTMYGESLFEHSRGINGQNIVPETWGVVPRSCNEIFEAVEYRKKSLNLKFDAEIAISYIEIFGDSVTDLLREGRSCGQSKVAAQRYVLDGSSEVKVTSMSDTLALLNQGESHKRKAATAMNQRSSRAHSVFIITMKQICVNSGVSRTNRLFLADLGGSEQSKKSQPVTSDQEQSKFERKQRAREAVNINLGLLALKQCVEALRKKSNFVPYTDSKLTMMLSSGLGGDSKTAVIVCGAQEQRHGLETIAAMKFGHVCKGALVHFLTYYNLFTNL